MRVSRVLIVTTLSMVLAAVESAWGADLLSLYREAAKQDLAVAAASAALQAARERSVQTEASNGVSAGLGAGVSANYNDVHTRGVRGSANHGYQTASISVSVNKPLYRPANQVVLEQTEAIVKVYEIALAAAQMDVAMRLSQTYFDVLLAQDNLTLVHSQKVAVAERLAQAKRNFEVGTATIVDTNEAQSRYDQVLAQEIVANNELDRTHWALRNVVGRYESNLKRLRNNAQVPTPNPSNMETWVNRADRDAYAVQLALQNLAVAEYGVKLAQAGKSWTLDAAASVAYNQSNAPVAAASAGVWTNVGMIGLNFNLPFDLSGGISARVREALATADKSRYELELARRTASLNIRQAFLGLTSGAASIIAQQQALKSAETLLDSTKLGLEVGVRTNLDVLNAQQGLTQVRRDLLLARYNTLLSEIRLKGAASVLSEADIQAANAYLVDE